MDMKYGVSLQYCVQTPSSETWKKNSQKSSEEFIENKKQF